MDASIIFHFCFPSIFVQAILQNQIDPRKQVTKALFKRIAIVSFVQKKITIFFFFFF